MRMPLPGIKTRLRIGVAAGTAVMAVFGLSTYAVTAGAAPQPSVSEAQAKVNQDNSQYDQANQQYDQAVQQAKQAEQKLAAIDEQVAANEVQFTKLRGAVAQIAAESYESGDTTSVAGLLTSNDPNTVLNGASLLLEISGNRNQQMQQFLAAVRQLRDSQQEAQRTRNGLAAIEQQKKQNQQHASHILTNAKAVLASLTPQQQQTVAANTIGAGATTATAYTGSTATQGGRQRRSPWPKRRPPARTSTVAPGRVRAVLTARDSPRPRGRRPVSRSRGRRTTIGPSCRTSPSRLSNRAT